MGVRDRARAASNALIWLNEQHPNSKLVLLVNKIPIKLCEKNSLHTTNALAHLPDNPTIHILSSDVDVVLKIEKQRINAHIVKKIEGELERNICSVISYIQEMIRLVKINTHFSIGSVWLQGLYSISYAFPAIFKQVRRNIAGRLDEHKALKKLMVMFSVPEISAHDIDGAAVWNIFTQLTPIDVEALSKGEIDKDLHWYREQLLALIVFTKQCHEQGVSYGYRQSYRFVHEMHISNKQTRSMVYLGTTINNSFLTGNYMLIDLDANAA